ncbi:MAG: ATP-dependent DNA helicase RecQ, partial [Planctomycetota bacterium]
LKSFRPGQREVIETIIAGHDCMCVMPTGGGKSLCYQLPGILRSGLTIVVSPLIALMKDQVDGLQSRGISAALINSSLSASEQTERLAAVASGHYQLVYVAPERLRNSRFLDAIRSTPIQLLAVDEAHCISQWGHDFRPDYQRIGQFRETLGGVQTVALTATATPKVREDIVNVLRLKKPKQFMSGFARPNLHFGVVTAANDKDKEQQLGAFLEQDVGSGIIYSATRKRCEALVDMISKKHKVSVGAYHGGLPPDQRRAIQDQFMKDKLRIVVATNAFGMGIDKPDLRFVVHYNMPGSLEAYYQEAGRAGRDGKHSQCVMLYSFQDRHIQDFFIDNSYPEKALIKSVYDFLLTRDEDPIELTLEEIRDRLGVQVSPEAIGSCLQVLARTRVLERLEMGGGLAMVRIESDLPSLVDLLPREAKVKRQVMRFIERAVGDRRGEDVYIHPRWLLQESGMQRDTLTRTLRELAKLDCFDYVPPFRGRAVHFRRKDVAFDDLEIDFEGLKKRKDAEIDRLNQVVHYAQSPSCRQSNVLKYFGDDASQPCGRCDRCQRRPGWPSMPGGEKQGSPSSREGGAVEADGTPKLDAMLNDAIEQVLESIHRIHGRLGKHLMAQYLCGSQNAKVQKLNLHRLSGFGLLKGCRQADAVSIIDALLAAGLLRQKEVNKNRPTIEVAAEWTDVKNRASLLAAVQVPGAIKPRLKRIASQPSAVVRGGASSDVPEEQGRVRTASELLASNAAASSRQPATTSKMPESSERSREASSANQAEANVSSRKDPTHQGSHGGPASAAAEKPRPDWQWTLALFEQGLAWAEVMQVRQMEDEELSASLCSALRAGGKIQRAWIKPGPSASLSVGQQRVVRELQRRAAAGIG